MKLLTSIAALLILNACTLTIQNVDSQGPVNDMIDQNLMTTETQP